MTAIRSSADLQPEPGMLIQLARLRSGETFPSPPSQPGVNPNAPVRVVSIDARGFIWFQGAACGDRELWDAGCYDVLDIPTRDPWMAL